MGRAKLPMEYISKEKTRNTTYQKRKQGLVKKASEFMILCDVETAMIIYGPNSQEPEIWPQDAEKVRQTITAFKQKKGESGKRTYTLKDFFEDRNKKAEEELAKARKKNMEFKRPTWFEELDSLPELQLRQFAAALEEKEKVLRARIEIMKRNNNDFPVNLQLPTFKFDLENKTIDHFHVPIQYSPPSGFDNQTHHMVHHFPMNHHHSGTMMGLLDGGLINHNNEAGSASLFLPFKREVGYDHLQRQQPPFGMMESGGGLFYNGLGTVTFCGPTLPQQLVPMVQQQFALVPNVAAPPQALDDSQVGNNDNDQFDRVGEFLMNNQRGKFF